MRTALDLPPHELDDQDRHILSLVREHGWFNTYVFGEGDMHGFCYTIGFWLSAGYPEIIVFSLERDDAQSVLWDLYGDLKAGRSPPVGKVEPNLIRGLDAMLLPVGLPHYAEYLAQARWFYRGEAFPCLQLIWPDTGGRFPWQEGYERRFLKSQPDLSPNGWSDAPPG